MNNFSLALVNATKLILSDSSPISPSVSIPFASKIDVVIASMNEVLGALNDGMYITTSNALPFALCTVVIVIGTSLFFSV